MTSIKNSIRKTNRLNKDYCKKCKRKLDYLGAEVSPKGLIKYYGCNCGVTEKLIPR